MDCVFVSSGKQKCLSVLRHEISRSSQSPAKPGSCFLGAVLVATAVFYILSIAFFLVGFGFFGAIGIACFLANIVLVFPFILSALRNAFASSDAELSIVALGRGK